MRAVGATEAVAAFACGVNPGAEGALPVHGDEVSRALLDTVGSALAGAGSSPDSLLRQWCDREGSVGKSIVWTSGASVSAATAALCNGTAAHALDWDDVSPGSAMHPSAVLLPALVAVAEEQGSSGAALVRAYDVGAAVFRAITQALPRATHYERGWHTTATVGRLAAVSALGALLRLEQATMEHALGLTASQAAGSLANFGSMTKPLHVGLAARDAVMAVGLAASGWTANPRELEARGGFFDLYGRYEQGRLDGLAEALADWRIRWPTDWAQKRYPACYATHRAIDAALELRSELAGRQPRAVRVVVEPGGLRPLIDRIPATATEAKFSMAYVVSVALTRGDVRLDDFSDAALDDPVIRRVMGTVSQGEAETPPIGDPAFAAGFTVLELELGSGERVWSRVDTTRGDASNPLARADLERKFADGCRSAGVGAAAEAEVAAALTALPTATDACDLHDALKQLAARQEVTA